MSSIDSITVIEVGSAGAQTVFVGADGAPTPVYIPGTGGSTHPFVDWFTGDGPPTVVIGAASGDMYYDRLNRTLYQLS